MKYKYTVLMFVLAIAFYCFVHNGISLDYFFLLFVIYWQAIQDIQCMEVSNSSMAILFIVCMIICILHQFTLSWISLGACSVSSILYVLYKLTNEKGIGGADVKFMFCCGSVMGFYLSFQSLFYACLFAIIFHFCTYFRYSKIPFIPFLGLGVYFSLM